MSALTAPPAAPSLLAPLSSRSILGIETSFRMACEDQYPGQRREDGGEPRPGGTQRRNAKRPQRVQTVSQHCSFTWKLPPLSCVCFCNMLLPCAYSQHLCVFAHISPRLVYLHVLFLSCSALSCRGGRKLLSANATLISKCLHNLTAEVLRDMLKPFLGFWLNYWGRCCGKLQSAKSFRQTAFFFVHERDQHMESLMHTTQN